MDRETMRKTAFAMPPASPPFPPVHIGFSGDLLWDSAVDPCQTDLKKGVSS